MTDTEALHTSSLSVTSLLTFIVFRVEFYTVMQSDLPIFLQNFVHVDIFKGDVI